MTEDFEEEWGWTPDIDYEQLKCNKTPEEIREIINKAPLEFSEEHLKRMGMVIERGGKNES